MIGDVNRNMLLFGKKYPDMYTEFYFDKSAFVFFAFDKFNEKIRVGAILGGEGFETFFVAIGFYFNFSHNDFKGLMKEKFGLTIKETL